MADTYVTPPTLGTPSTPSSSGSFTQGAALPNITTTQQQATAAPSWYMDYLNNLATTGTQAGANAQYVGAQPLQQQAFGQVASDVGNYQPTLNQATGAVSSAIGGTSPLGVAQPYLSSAANPTYNTVNQYMNPYVNDVVSQIGNLAQQNIMQNVAPQATAGIVGSGQFGSKRGAEALGQTLANYGQQTTAQQLGALQKGYSDAMAQAQAQAQLQGQLGTTAGQLASSGQQNLISAGQIGGQLATTTQNLGLGDVNALSTMGSQQQQIAQNQQLFPLQLAAQQAALLKGYTVPTSVSSTYTGPIPGAYQASPLQQIAGVGTGLMSLFQTPAGGGATPITNIGSWLSGLTGSSGSNVDLNSGPQNTESWAMPT